MTWLRQWLAAWLSKRERATPQGATPPPEDCPAFVLCIPDDHPPLDDTPDHPADFGLKTCWLAVKTEEPERVLTLLKAQDVRRANWQNGIHVAYWASRKKYQENIYVPFISPSVRGWVFVVGVPPLEAAHLPTTQHFEALTAPLVAHFPEVQAFGSYRVVDYVAWAKAVDGQWLRCFAYADGEILQNEGAQTAEERQLGLIELHGLEFAEGEFEAWIDCDGSDEFMPLKLAGLWSINPDDLPEMDIAPGVGWVGRIF